MKNKQVLTEIPLHQVDQIFIFGAAQVSTQAMIACFAHGIPVYFFSNRGRYYGVLHRPDETAWDLHRRQYALTSDPRQRLDLARRVVAAKIGNYRTLIGQHARHHPAPELEEVRLALKQREQKALAAADLGNLRGLEGSAAAAYFKIFGSLIRVEAFSFTRRVRRPPTDPVNSLLSFAYTMIHYNVYSYLVARGFDPCVGFLHEVGGGTPALACDLTEEFRAPLGDALVLGLLNNRVLKPDDFFLADGNPQPCILREGARVTFIHAVEEKMATLREHPDVGHKVDWRRIIDLQVNRLRRYVLGQTDRYEPYSWS